VFPTEFLTIDRILLQSPAGSKKRALEQMGGLLSSASEALTPEMVFDKLLQRERLGSTGLGRGIALPHARMDGVTEACGGFIQLQSGIDFDAIDDQPVDLVFGLLVPVEATNEHLKLLATLARLFNNQNFCDQLRESRDPAQLQRLFEHAAIELASAP